MRRDYSWIAKKLNTEYEKAKKEMPRNLNTKLLDIYNKQLCPLVHGNYGQSKCLPPHTHAEHLVDQISESVGSLRIKSYRAVGILPLSQDTPDTDMSLSQLIDRKVKGLENSLDQTKNLFLRDTEKKKYKTNVDKKSEQDFAKMKRAFEYQRDDNKKLQSLLKAKNKDIQNLSKQNEHLQTENKHLRDRPTELEKEPLRSQRSGPIISEYLGVRGSRPYFMKNMSKGEPFLRK